MRVMLDTDICIYLIKCKSDAVLRRLRSSEPGELCISAVTLAELSFGVAKSQSKERNAAALDTFLLPLAIAAFDDAAARIYGTVRSDLEKRGTPIGALDTMIGSHALSLRVDLATNNAREFSRIDGLRVTDWTT
jgi:tRNA(fMet)-specific endonuclease VapC